MNFSEAMKAVADGKKVRRDGWDVDVALAMKRWGGVQRLADTCSGLPYAPSIVDVTATDWEVVD